MSGVEKLKLEGGCEALSKGLANSNQIKAMISYGPSNYLWLKSQVSGFLAVIYLVCQD